MSISSIPSTFLAGFRDRLTSDTLQLLWNNRSSTEKTQLTKQASIPAPPSSFLPSPTITSLAREAAWLSLTDAQRATYLDGSAGVTTTGLISNAATATTYRRSGFGSQSSATPSAAAALDLDGRLDARSAVPGAADSAAFRAIWKENFATNGLLDAVGSGDTNGGAVFVTIRAGTGADRATNPFVDDPTTTADAHGRFETQLTDQAKGLTDRFGTSLAILGYDANDNGYLDSEAELFGFDGPTAGPALTAQALVSDRLMVLTASGQSVRVNQSSFATTANPSGGYLPYTTASTVLRPNADTGKLEIAVVSAVGIGAPGPVASPALVGVPGGDVAVGSVLRFTVTFGRDVVVTPDPAVPTTVGFTFGGISGPRTAELESASGSTLVFRYAPTAGDVGATGMTVAAGTPIVLGGTTTIRDAAGRNASLLLPAVNNPTTRVP